MRIEIVSESDRGRRVCAASARISTQEGSAARLFEKSLGGEKDIRLVGKVLSSGHKSVVEHDVATVAFSDVPVTVEQYMIEHRLCSFTVKSRRYVDYANAGFYVPEGLSEEKKAVYTKHMEGLFASYEKLTALGIPKEDARFLLPYCFYSNFYMTANVREWITIVRDIMTGRGSSLVELREAAEPIRAWLEERYPEALAGEWKKKQTARLIAAKPDFVGEPNIKSGEAHVLAFSAYRPEVDFAMLVKDARPRELELMQYVFEAKNVSLAAVTHFARHRIQSPIFPDVAKCLERNSHILPESVANNPEALALYEKAFADNYEAAKAFAGEDCLRFFALAGNTVDFVFAMNARELLHFMKLRTCNRAQWEIRGLSWQLLKELRERDPEVFGEFGPSCYVDGVCPEGRLSCGKPYKREEKGNE